MEGGFRKSLQLSVASGYCVFEDDICVDLSGVLDERPNYANIPFSELLARPCVDRLEVLDGGPDYATAFLTEFFSRARCPPCLGAPRSCSGQGVWLRGEESSSKMFQTFLFLPLFSFLFLFFSFGN